MYSSQNVSSTTQWQVKEEEEESGYFTQINKSKMINSNDHEKMMDKMEETIKFFRMELNSVTDEKTELESKLKEKESIISSLHLEIQSLKSKSKTGIRIKSSKFDKENVSMFSRKTASGNGENSNDNGRMPITEKTTTTTKNKNNNKNEKKPLSSSESDDDKSMTYAFKFCPSPASIEYDQFSSHLQTFKSLHLKVPSVATREETNTFWNKALEVLSNLLQNNVNTLEKIKMPLFLRYFSPRVQWPVLPKVKFLVLDNADETLECFHPPPSFLQKTFPNLRRIQLEDTKMLRQSDKFWDSFFCGKFDKVEVLESSLSSNFPMAMKTNFPKVFSNLVKLALPLDFDANLENKFSRIWQLTELESLKLEFTIRNYNLGASFPNLDHIFTGFSSEMCRNLMTSEETFVVDHRDNLSILNLQYLENLELKFIVFRPELEEDYNLISKISGQYAFSIFDNLNVSISLSKYAASPYPIQWNPRWEHHFQTLAPYAQINFKME